MGEPVPVLAYQEDGPQSLEVTPRGLEGEEAVPRLRELMGATNPANAAPGTIRATYGKDIQTNSVHGSDSPESARREVRFFFPEESA